MRIKVLLFFISICLSLTAQTQNGYVKTKGRLGSNGSVIKGTRLSGAMVTVKGRNAVLSGNNGKFTLTIPSRTYYLQNVQKQGYVIVDPDVLSHQYSYSKDPLVLVLESQGQQTDDSLAAARKIRRTLQRRIQEKEDELEALKAKHKVTEEEYRKQMKEILNTQQSNEKLIGDMAERFSRIDYDLLDEFNTRISSYILDGKLEKADSLLKTKGDINTRSAELRQLQEQNVKEEAEIAKRKMRLEKNKELAQKELNDLAQDCFSKYEIFKMQHKNDSAAYYIKLRADLDTTNVEWLLEAGIFVKDYLANYKETEQILTNAENRFTKQISDYKYPAIKVYINFSSLYYTTGQYQKSIDYSFKALSLINEDMPNYLKFYSAICGNIGSSYQYLDRWDDAQEYLKKSLQTCIDAFGEYHKETAICYSNLGIFYQRINQDSLALPYYLKALEIGQRDTIACYEELDYFFNNLAVAYNKMRDYESAEIYSQMALERRKALYGENHPSLAVIYHNSGVRKMRQKQYGEALTHFAKATNIWENTYGEEHHLIDAYGTIGQVYELKGDLNQALTYYEKGADVGIKYYGRDNSEAWVLLPSICMALENLIKTNPTDSIVARYQQFQSGTAVIAIIPGGVDTPAAKLGMSGIYFILEYGDWHIDKNDSFFDEFIRLQGKPRSVVFLKNDNIETHYFENTIGGNFMMRYVSSEEKNAIIETYKNMKK